MTLSLPARRTTRTSRTERLDSMTALVKNIRGPSQPTVNERQEHVTTHRPCRSQRKCCVIGRGVNSPHRRSDAQDDVEGVRHVSMDYGFLGEEESEEQMPPVLVFRERRHKMTWAMLVPRKRTEFPWIAKSAAKFIDQLEHSRVTLMVRLQLVGLYFLRDRFFF